MILIVLLGWFPGRVWGSVFICVHLWLVPSPLVAVRACLFHLGDLAIPSFWAMAFLGFFAALLVIRRTVAERGYDQRWAYDFVLWAYVGGWVGARLFVIPTGWDYFVDDPLSFLLSSSGWVWYGGVLGGALAVLWWGRRSACRHWWRATSRRRRWPSAWRSVASAVSSPATATTACRPICPGA